MGLASQALLPCLCEFDGACEGLHPGALGCTLHGNSLKGFCLVWRLFHSIFILALSGKLITLRAIAQMVLYVYRFRFQFGLEVCLYYNLIVCWCFASVSPWTHGHGTGLHCCGEQRYATMHKSKPTKHTVGRGYLAISTLCFDAAKLMTSTLERVSTNKKLLIDTTIQTLLSSWRFMYRSVCFSNMNHDLT